MRDWMAAMMLLLFTGIAFSQTVETPPYLKSMGKVFGILLKIAMKGGGLSISFYVVLLIVGLVVFLILRNAALKFLEGAFGERKSEADAVATLIALAITFLTFSNTNLILAILTIASAPLSVYFILALIFGAIGAFWVGWERAWGAAAFVAFIGLFIIYNFVPINVQTVNQIAGTNLEGEYMTPWQAMEEVSPGLGTTFGGLFIVGIIITGIYALWGIITGGRRGGG